MTVTVDYVSLDAAAASRKDSVTRGEERDALCVPRFASLSNELSCPFLGFSLFNILDPEL